MNLIKFSRFKNHYIHPEGWVVRPWEYATSEEDLMEKLGGDGADIVWPVQPQDPWWRRFFKKWSFKHEN